MGHEARFASFCFTPLNNCHFSSWRETKYAFCVILFHAIEQLPFFIMAWNKIRICSIVSDAKLCNNVANYGTNVVYFKWTLKKVIFECVPEYNWPVLWPIRFLTHFFFAPRHLVHPRPFWPIGLCWLLNYPGHFLEFGIALQRPKVPLSKPKAGRKKCKRQIIYCCQYCFWGDINNGLRMASA